MSVLHLHSLQFRNNSKKFTHVVATRASSSPSSSVSSQQSVSTPKSNDFNRLISKFKSNSVRFALSGTLALAVSLSGGGFAEAKVGVNKPELLPKEFTTVIDVAGFLSDGQEKRLAKEIDALEKDTGFKLRVLAQNYPDTPGLAIKDFWQVDDRTIVFVADPTFGNILNFNVGETVDLDVPRSFWSRLAGKYGNMFYWKEKGEDASVEAAVMAISSCLREPVGANNCAEGMNSSIRLHKTRINLSNMYCIPSIKMASQRLTTTLKSLITINHQHPLLHHHHHHHHHHRHQVTTQFPNSSSHLIPINLNLRPPPLSMSSQASPVPPPDSSTPIKTVKVVIKGRVQGVFYRDWTVQNATELGLKGWVRNRRDGSVEALFSGSPDKVGEMQERCRRGPPSAMVTGLNVSPSSEDPGSGFERRPSV